MRETNDRGITKKKKTPKQPIVVHKMIQEVGSRREKALNKRIHAYIITMLESTSIVLVSIRVTIRFNS